MSDILQAKTITGEYSGFADSALRDVSGTFLTAVPDTYLQNTDLSTADGKVTAISGIPLSAGGDVPEGVMVESGLEYDNTEISGYSGSAFKDVALTDVVTANSGVWGGSALPVSAGNGVKISLQNDTLVFESDETVLWEGTATSASWPITLSESTNNFESFKIDWCPYTEVSNWTAPYDIVNTKLDNGTMHLLGQGLSDNGTYAMMSNLLISANDDALTKLQFMSITMHGSVMECGSLEGYKIYKVVGVNRIAGE